jgi:hypothetical protein
MHDTQYRVAVAWQNGGYNQPPHPSYWIGVGMPDPPRPLLYFGGELRGDYNSDGQVDSADYSVWRDSLGSTTNLSADGDHNGVIDAADRAVWQANFGATAASGVAFARLTAGHAESEPELVSEPGASALRLMIQPARDSVRLAPGSALPPVQDAGDSPVTPRDSRLLLHHPATRQTFAATSVEQALVSRTEAATDEAFSRLADSFAQRKIGRQL